MSDFVRTYPSGVPYRLVRSRTCPDMPRPAKPVAWLRWSDMDWPAVWAMTRAELRRLGYCDSTLLSYRQFLRSFVAAFPGLKPAQVRTADIQAYLGALARKSTSWSHKAMAISVLRTVFDKLGGMAIACRFTTPRRPSHLPETLSRDEITRVIKATGNVRDQFIVALLYGCGLRPGELRNLRWGDFSADGSMLALPGDGALRARNVPVPERVQPLVRLGLGRCDALAPVFPGRSADKGLGLRALALLLRKLGEAARIGRPLTALVLRHSFAAHSLQNGMDIRTLQERMGHRDIKSTMIYGRLTPPSAQSPLDSLINVSTADVTERVTPVSCHSANAQASSDRPVEASGLAMPDLRDLDPAKFVLPFPVEGTVERPPGLWTQLRQFFGRVFKT